MLKITVNFKKVFINKASNLQFHFYDYKIQDRAPGSFIWLKRIFVAEGDTENASFALFCLQSSLWLSLPARQIKNTIS